MIEKERMVSVGCGGWIGSWGATLNGLSPTWL
jgi:hypothetical protein